MQAYTPEAILPLKHDVYSTADTFRYGGGIHFIKYVSSIKKNTIYKEFHPDTLLVSRNSVSTAFPRNHCSLLREG
jgi:hypothetical protein